jgi:5-hydroxyisourate hydrolase
MKVTLKAILLASMAFSSLSIADVSVHVLDMTNGLPGQGITVSFYEKKDNSWQLLKTQTTDENGRIASFDVGNIGVYRAEFHVSKFFQEQKTNTFYSIIPVDFKVENSDAHYHIPLLLSPYGYSTYRGN